ncbi:hypothetical protein VTL71DRAFT_16107 [Oculimacula yallundae]|uniref:Uncharacterized protein n=1 Tax=Oculimacula yallundae TaxID=86028 RepID=A0ABR4CDI8_9HELO
MGSGDLNLAFEHMVLLKLVFLSISISSAVMNQAQASQPWRSGEARRKSRSSVLISRSNVCVQYACLSAITVLVGGGRYGIVRFEGRPLHEGKQSKTKTLPNRTQKESQTADNEKAPIEPRQTYVPYYPQHPTKGSPTSLSSTTKCAKRAVRPVSSRSIVSPSFVPSSRLINFSMNIVSTHPISHLFKPSCLHRHFCQFHNIVISSIFSSTGLLT